MQVGEPINVALQGKGPDGKKLTAGVVEVSFKSPVKVCLAQATIAAPHWKLGELVNDGPWSKRPAAYLIEGAAGATMDVEVKVKVNVADNVSGDGKLIGSLGDFRITGTCPLSVGEHTVQAKIEKLPAAIGWIMGDMYWGIESDSLGASVPLNGTRVELFFLLSTPTPIYQNKDGVWAEALRFLCGRAGMRGISKPADAVAKVARYCHTGHKLFYNSAGGGAPRYGVSYNGGTFKLSRYLTRAIEFANCYDQAAAVQALAGCFGPKVLWIYLEPYGFITLTMLLGYGPCNNPFFMPSNDPLYPQDATPQVIGMNDPARTSFGNHAFCAYGGKVVDACGGPHLGSESYEEYVEAGIDTKTKLYKLYKDYRPGTALDMQFFPGVTGVA